MPQQSQWPGVHTGGKQKKAKDGEGLLVEMVLRKALKDGLRRAPQQCQQRTHKNRG